MEGFMGFYKKTILLKNNKTNGGMGLLTIEQTNSGVFASVKSYDIPEHENMVLGLAVNGKAVAKQNIYFANGNTYTFKLQNDFDIDGRIGAVMVAKGKDITPLVWGTNNSKSSYKEDIIKMFKDDNNGYTKPNNDVEHAKVEVTPKPAPEPKRVESEVKQVSEFVSTEAEKNKSLYEDTPEEIENLIDENMDEAEDFYHLIKDQLDELFDKFPRNAMLEQVVDNSKWVTIDYENAGKDYVVGLLYGSENNLEYIAYGVPGDLNNPPPSQIADYSQWLPLDSENPQGEGYWVMFQDANTGDSVRLKA